MGVEKGRLFTILYILLERESVTAEELSRRLEVSVRTIYRDIDSLSAAGIPVYSARGKGGGIRLLPGFSLDRAMLTRTDQDEILTAIRGLRSSLGEDGSSDLLQRLSGLFQRERADWIDVDFSPWGGEDQRPKFQLLKQAILDRRVITFLYYNARGERHSRRAQPFKLWFKGSAWYLSAFCLERQSVRTFKICRIQQLELTEEFFDASRTAVQEAPDSRSQLPAVQLELWFAPSVAYRLYETFSPEEISVNQDGSFSVRAAFPEDRWVYGFLLSFGPEVKVLSPVHIQRILAQMARQLLAYYPEDNAGGPPCGGR